MQIFVNLLRMLEYYLHGLAKPGDKVLNQRILMYEKRHFEFMLRIYVERKQRNKLLAIKTKNI